MHILFCHIFPRYLVKEYTILKTYFDINMRIFVIVNEVYN